MDGSINIGVCIDLLENSRVVCSTVTVTCGEGEFYDANITRRCSGPFDSRVERGNAHNPHGCQMADELGVMQ